MYHGKGGDSALNVSSETGQRGEYRIIFDDMPVEQSCFSVVQRVTESYASYFVCWQLEQMYGYFHTKIPKFAWKAFVQKMHHNLKV